jgi:glutamine synthetase
MDPFFAQPTMAIFCDILEPITGEAYNRDPRMTAKKAEAYLKSDRHWRHGLFRPGSRILHLRRRPFKADPYNTGFKLDSRTADQHGHRIRDRATWVTVRAPRAATSRSTGRLSGQDMRSEMLTVMAEMGVTVEKHHHEVAAAQHELGIKFDTLTTHGRQDADLQVRRPQRRPCLRQDGNLHAEAGLRRQRLGHARAPVDLEGRQAAFAGDEYADLSETCLYYIGGIIKHAKALNAFTNPSTNSYKRLVPGYEAPVLLAYSARNRSASCRIPFTPRRRASASKSASRIRPPTRTWPSRPC